MKVFLAGPIDYWWNENWQSEQHLDYVKWRDYINKFLVEAGHLVYRPHEAFKGAWDESAQVVNDAALKMCDIFIYLTPPNVPAYGTAHEKELASVMGKDIRWAPPNVYDNIQDIIIPLDNPYNNVEQRTASKPAKTRCIDCRDLTTDQVRHNKRFGCDG